MNFENLVLEIEDRIALLQINRPKKLNALNRATISELNKAFTSLESDPGRSGDHSHWGRTQGLCGRG